MITALLLSCALAVVPDVVSDFDTWMTSQHNELQQPAVRQDWIDRFNAVDPRRMSARAFEQLGDLYNWDDAINAMAAYRMACTATGGLTAPIAAKFGMAARTAGSPRDAADALRYFAAAGGNAELGGNGELADLAIAQFRTAAPTLVLDAAIKGLQDGTARTRADADAAIADWREAMAAGSMDRDSAGAHLASLIGALNAWGIEAPGTLVDFDPLGLAWAGLALTTLDPANSVGVGAIGGALRAASLSGDPSAILEIAELAASVGPAPNNAALNELYFAAGRMLLVDSLESKVIGKRLLELSIAAEERGHPDTFQTMSSWQMSLLRLANHFIEVGDIDGAKEAILRLKTAKLEGFVLSSLSSTEETLTLLEANEAPDPQPATNPAASTQLPAPPAETASLPEVSSAPTLQVQFANAPTEPTSVQEASTNARGIALTLFVVVAVAAILGGWIRRPGSSQLNP